jgi:hypothetical protein
MAIRYKANWVAAAAVLAVSPVLVQASVFGTLGNFDVVNDTGKTARGFEIELEGLHASDVTDTFGGAGRGFPTTVERYGAPTVTDYTNGAVFGVRVTYSASFSQLTGLWNVGTPSGVFNTPGESCWTGGGIGYGPSTPCDHFGVGTRVNASKTTYNWLLETATPGVTTNGLVNLPAPIWVVTPAPPPVVGAPPAPPVVVAQIQAPAPEVENQFGPAMWVKVYTTELEGPVALEDLVGGNDKVKLAKQHTEMEWQLLQKDPGNPLSGVIDNGGAAAVGAKAESVIRRYEFYQYVGDFDPENHEAKPTFNDSRANTDPALGLVDVGNFIGAQNAGLNLVAAAAPVPEPQAWALMLGGLFTLGWRVRRRQARPVRS